jgi:hypothetical protein
VSCVAISHIYKDACSLAQEKGPASLIYHEPALEVRFVRRAAGTTSFLAIRAGVGRLALVSGRFGLLAARDATRYYLIIPDAIGHRKSSKPSDGLHGDSRTTITTTS